MQSIIIPALDLIDGHVVRLHQGDYAQQTTYSDNPIEQFASYIQQGAQQLHLVDLTGAKDPSKRQTALIGKIIAATQSNIQVGGGIRTEQDVADLLAVGENRVVIGSTAVTQLDMVQGWFTKYGAEKFVLALDVRIENGQELVAIKGFEDKVFLKTLAYNPTPTGIKGCLTQIREAVVITTSTAPTWYLKFFCGNVIGKTMIGHTLKGIGVGSGRWINFGGMDKSTAQARQSFLDKLSDKLYLSKFYLQ